MWSRAQPRGHGGHTDGELAGGGGNQKGKRDRGIERCGESERRSRRRRRKYELHDGGEEEKGEEEKKKKGRKRVEKGAARWRLATGLLAATGPPDGLHPHRTEREREREREIEREREREREISICFVHATSDHKSMFTKCK